MFRLSAQGGAREPIVENRVAGTYVRRQSSPARSTAVTNILDYSTRGSKFERPEPHFQLSATTSALTEGTETAVALPQSRECTKEPISALPNYASKEKFGATTVEQNCGMSYRKNGDVEVVPVADLIARSAFFFVGNATQVDSSRLILHSCSVRNPC